MTLQSCLYEGEVRHRRFTPVEHAFRYSLFMLYVDLDELPTLFRRRWLWSVARPNVGWFRRADHLGPADLPLAEAVRNLVETRTGRRPDGSIRLLTHFRYFGFGMNPISLYYCFGAEGQVETVVAEVTNTPWGEQHCYVLTADESSNTPLRAMAAKELHVSPFFGMSFDYHFALTAPGDSLSVHIENHATDQANPPLQFDARLLLERRPLTGWGLARALVRYPLMTVRVFAAIYYQALRLWMKGVPYVPPPAVAKSPRRVDSPHSVLPREQLESLTPENVSR